MIKEIEEATIKRVTKIKEYTEPKKLSGWINVYEKELGHTREYADEIARARTWGDKRVACLDLSVYNVGDGL